MIEQARLEIVGIIQHQLGNPTLSSHSKTQSSVPIPSEELFHNELQVVLSDIGSLGRGISELKEVMTGNSDMPLQKTDSSVIRQADNLLRQNRASGLHELLLEQLKRSESLMSDNALL